jgi:hypothetical protein
MGFSCSVTVGGEPSGHISIDVEHDALQLAYAWRPPGSTVWTRGCQRVLLAWTRCNFGGARPWFRCDGCGRRAAKLYLGAGEPAFACRLCHRLAYRSQSEQPATRAITKARKLRERLGGGPSVLDPLPGKPPRMHRWTYFRVSAAAIRAQERALGLEIDEIRRRFPGLLTQDAAAPSKKSKGFFSARAARAFAAWNGRGRSRRPHGVQTERPARRAGVGRNRPQPGQMMDPEGAA